MTLVSPQIGGKPSEITPIFDGIRGCFFPPSWSQAVWSRILCCWGLFITLQLHSSCWAVLNHSGVVGGVWLLL